MKLKLLIQSARIDYLSAREGLIGWRDFTRLQIAALRSLIK